MSLKQPGHPICLATQSAQHASIKGDCDGSIQNMSYSTDECRLVVNRLSFSLLYLAAIALSGLGRILQGWMHQFSVVTTTISVEPGLSPVSIEYKRVCYRYYIQKCPGYMHTWKVVCENALCLCCHSPCWPRISGWELNEHLWLGSIMTHAFINRFSFSTP